MGKEQFVEKFIGVLSKEFPEYKIKEEDGHMLKLKKGEKEMGVSVENMIREVERGMSENEVIKGRINTLKEMLGKKSIIFEFENWKLAKDKLLLIPKNKRYYDEVKESIEREVKDKSKIEDNMLMKRDFVNDISFYTVINGEHGFAFAMGNLKKKWKKTEEQIETQAMKNVENYKISWEFRNKKIEKDVLGKEVNFGVITAKDEPGNPNNTLASIILLRQKDFRKLIDENGYAGKDVYVVVPSREEIVIVEEDISNLQNILMIGHIRKMGASYPVSEKPFKFSKDGVVSNISIKGIEQALAFLVQVDKETGSVKIVNSLGMRNDG